MGCHGTVLRSSVVTIGTMLYMYVNTLHALKYQQMDFLHAGGGGAGTYVGLLKFLNFNSKLSRAMSNDSVHNLLERTFLW